MHLYCKKILFNFCCCCCLYFITSFVIFKKIELLCLTLQFQFLRVIYSKQASLCGNLFLFFRIALEEEKNKLHVSTSYLFTLVSSSCSLFIFYIIIHKKLFCSKPVHDRTYCYIWMNEARQSESLSLFSFLLSNHFSNNWFFFQTKFRLDLKFFEKYVTRFEIEICLNLQKAQWLF